MHQEICKLCDWLTENKLYLNIKKTNFVLYCTAKTKLTYQPQIMDLKESSLEMQGICEISRNLNQQSSVLETPY